MPLVVEELLLVHSELGNWTTLNRENCSRVQFRGLIIDNQQTVLVLFKSYDLQGDDLMIY